MAIKRPTSYNTGNRDVNTQADALKSVIKQADNAFASIEQRLTLLQPPGMVFPDDYTYLWWPCSDTIDSGAAGSVVSRTDVSATLVATGSSANEGGLTPQGKGYARIYGASGGYSGGAGVIPASGAVSLSAWVRLGTVATKAIAGYITGAGSPVFFLATDASGRLTGTANTAAGSKVAGGTNDMTLAPNTWYFVWMRFAGDVLTAGLDTHYQNTTFAATTMSWTAGSWRLGFAGTNTGEGLYRDVRVHRRAIPDDFVNDSYAAWHRLEDRNG